MRAYFRGFSRKLCSANMTITQSARSFRTPAYCGPFDFRKAPPTGTSCRKLGTQYACSKRSEINSNNPYAPALIHWPSYVQGQERMSLQRRRRSVELCMPRLGQVVVLHTSKISPYTARGHYLWRPSHVHMQLRICVRPS